MRATTRKGSRRSNAILSTHEMEGQGKFPSGIGKSSRMTGKGRGSERCLSCQMDRPSQNSSRQKTTNSSRVYSEENYSVTSSMIEAYKNMRLKQCKISSWKPCKES
jgi:hypothetical protein